MMLRGTIRGEERLAGKKRVLDVMVACRILSVHVKKEGSLRTHSFDREHFEQRDEGDRGVISTGSVVSLASRQATK
jgi:hypothetical protein